MKLTYGILKTLINAGLSKKVRRSVEGGLSTDSDSAYRYAQSFLHGPFPLGEPAIAEEIETAYRYARYVLKGPFPMGEKVISQGASYSWWYVAEVLKGPFPMGEKVMAKSSAGDSYLTYLRHHGYTDDAERFKTMMREAGNE